MKKIIELAQRITDYTNAVYPPNQYHAPATTDEIIDMFYKMPSSVYGGMLEDYQCEHFTANFPSAAVAEIISELAESVPGAVERYCYVFFKDGDVISCAENQIGTYLHLDSFSHAKICHTGIDKDGEVGEIYDYTVKVSRDPDRK